MIEGPASQESGDKLCQGSQKISSPKLATEAASDFQGQQNRFDTEGFGSKLKLLFATSSQGLKGRGPNRLCHFCLRGPQKVLIQPRGCRNSGQLFAQFTVIARV